MRIRRLAPVLLAALALSPAHMSSGAAQAQSGAPHAWLFGLWTGGLFPVPSGGVPVKACLAQPVVVFTRDVVMRASLTDPLYTQRVIETARTSGTTTEIRFAPDPGSTEGGLLGAAATPPPGFGCGDPNVLRVQRRSDNEIVFPGCADFPNPLVRCTPR